MKKKIKQSIGLYSVFLGASVLMMWGFILVSEPIREGKTEMTFHLVSELIMAVFCIAGGLKLILKGGFKPIIAAHAMVVYSVINAAGYYLERGDQAMTAFFAILFLISTTILIFITAKPV